MITRIQICASTCSVPLLLSALAPAQSPAPPPPDRPVTPAVATPAPAPKPATTQAASLIDDLQSSFIWTENAKSLADSFATTADADAFAGAASLFRVASRSLSILTTQYSESVKKLGATPTSKADDSLPKVKTTKENLQAFAKLLATRRTGPLADAATRHRTGPNREATKTLQYEREALTELARFSSDAAETLDKLKAGKKDFFVSRPCGYVTDKLVADKCPVCKTGKDQFEKVN